MTRIIGIDLGTRNSAAAVLRDGNTKMIEYGDREVTIPSYVYINGDIVQVGEEARDRIETEAENVASAFKRKMGSTEVVSKSINKSPTELSAILLKKIKELAEEHLGEKVDGAVITVPADFDNNQRDATKDAGNIAGLEVKALINEPTAAAVAYGFKENDDSSLKMLVFDIGAGTLDVTYMERRNGQFMVESTGGDQHLGGVDMDELLLKYMQSVFSEKGAMFDKGEIARLRRECERAKIKLSSDSAKRISFMGKDSEGHPKGFSADITREKLEDLVRPIVEKIGPVITQVLADAGTDATKIDKVVMVGGPSKMPIVRAYVEGIFGKEKITSVAEVDPMECVAKGAAILAWNLGPGSGIGQSGGNSDVFTDIVTKSLGIKVVNGVHDAEGEMSVLIKKGTPIPCYETCDEYTNARDNGDAVRVDLLQGEEKLASQNTAIGGFDMPITRPGPAGSVRFEVTFEYDLSGTVHATVLEIGTSNKKKYDVKLEKSMDEVTLNRKKAELSRIDIQ